MGGTTKVLIWGHDDVMSQGVEIFLRDSGDYEVIRAAEDVCYEVLIREIEQHNIDVVILNPGQQQRDSQLPLQLMKHFPGMKVITLNLECSSVDMYNKQIVWMHTVSDLLDLVKKDSSHPSGETSR